MFSMKGRLNRGRYFLYMLACGAVSFLSGLLSGTEFEILAILVILVYVICGIVMVCQIVRRLHDLDRPASNYWLLLIPIYNIYLFLILLFQQGTTGVNSFGQDPLGKVS